MSNARTREEDCKTLRVLLLNFLDHEILLVSRAGGNYTAIRRYNRNDLSRRSVRRVLDALEKAGFIQQEIGRYDLKDGSGKRTKVARYQKLKTILGEFACRGESYVETIKLKNEAKALTDYSDDPQILSMRSTLSRYQDLLNRTSVTYRGMPVDTSRHVYRVFNSRFDRGGRFYGPAWQLMSSLERQRLQIHGKPTIELDFTAFEPHILHAKETRKIYMGDPYAFDQELPRGLVKTAMTRLLNVKSRSAATRLTKQDAKQADLNALAANGLTVSDVTSRIIQHHSDIAHQLAQNGKEPPGLELQFIGSQITERIIRTLTADGIPVLTIHDSYIVESAYEQRLRDTMIESFLVITGSQSTGDRRELENILIKTVRPSAPSSKELSELPTAETQVRCSYEVIAGLLVTRSGHSQPTIGPNHLGHTM